MKKVMIFAVLCVGGAIGYFGINALFSAGKIEKAQQEAAAQINKNLPMQVDELTTLEAVSSEGAALVYNYKVDVKKDETDLDVFTSEVKKNLMATMCGKEPFSKLYSAGASYIYLYSDTSGDELTEITIDADTCKS
ncbi:type II secretion system pilot lipoprotein GspS-beta [Kiloniella majae]|uniref:type II secretion system pilot lipoprotein GspS-beta n=1 Tax=Kiloniella majae TaxID=1938558 RepID=UPI000A277CF1|nr:type II secretion system pilot lipoprotein GspS-beta [Kiloniella majae]